MLFIFQWKIHELENFLLFAWCWQTMNFPLCCCENKNTFKWKVSRDSGRLSLISEQILSEVSTPKHKASVLHFLSQLCLVSRINPRLINNFPAYHVFWLDVCLYLINGRLSIIDFYSISWGLNRKSSYRIVYKASQPQKLFWGNKRSILPFNSILITRQFILMSESFRDTDKQ